jgi:heme/copper-type cytochrome/quinol oxidase subunit 4
MKKSVGIILGLISLIFAVRYFLYSYRDGNPKWFMVVMVCGMLLILYYTVTFEKSDDEDYS